MSSSALSSDQIFGHVKDANYFHVPRAFDVFDGDGHLALPQPIELEHPIVFVENRRNGRSQQDGRNTRL